jgi:hypothetical protein
MAIKGRLAHFLEGWLRGFAFVFRKSPNSESRPATREAALGAKEKEALRELERLKHQMPEN